jgi:hypothetical protein
MVTGPSLTSSRAIFAPKTPVSTGTPSARSGGAAAAKLGRLPFAVSAISVNRTPSGSDAYADVVAARVGS